jgi:DNA-binding CsgD family transcriptional regulator
VLSALASHPRRARPRARAGRRAALPATRHRGRRAGFAGRPTARESEVLRAASVIEGEAELAWELFLSLHAVRERLARLQAKLGVRTAGDAVARALRESL